MSIKRIKGCVLTVRPALLVYRPTDAMAESSMFLFVLMLLLLGSSVSAVLDMELAATCDNQMELYVDGIQLTGSSAALNWQVASSFDIPSDASTIAMKCVDLGYIGGLLVAMDNGVVSDASWKCTQDFYTGWHETNYDDSAWPYAHIFQQNGGGVWGQVNGGPIQGISSNAFWIWTEEQNPPTTAYCRKQLNTMDISATCDNEMTIYADGVEVSDAAANDWTTSSAISLPASTDTVAIKCVDLGVIGGVLAYLGHGAVTDGSWKCTNGFFPGWELSDYDDSAWQQAVEYQQNDGGGIWGQVNGGQPVAGIPSNAYWIWTADQNPPTTVYCRKRFCETTTGPCSKTCDVGSWTVTKVCPFQTFTSSENCCHGPCPNHLVCKDYPPYGGF